MAKVTLSIPNLEKAISQIGKFRLEKAQEVKDELNRAAFAIHAQAVRDAPVDQGRLWTSIQRQELGPFSISVGTNVEYAAFVEFGTRYQRAQPYLFPAAEAERQRFLANLKRILSTP